MNLLIVDDNPQVRSIIRSFVSSLADSVSECEDGADAVAAYAECRPDWVLMDVRMAGVDGLTATRMLREEFPEARVVIVTSYDDDDLREAARAAGAEGYVSKEDLLALRSVLTRGGSA